MGKSSWFLVVFLLLLITTSSAYSTEVVTWNVERFLAADVTPDCGPVQLKTLTDVCKRYTTSEGKVLCFQAGKDAKLDQCALGFCDTYHTEDGCTQCIRVIRNKKYSVDALKQCNQFSEESVATSCMDASGTPVRADGT